MTEHVDGNALAGALAELFAFDMTTAVGRCAGCGTIDVFANAMVYEASPGWVVRCAHCDTVLGTLVRSETKTWFSLSGVSAIEVPAPSTTG